MKTESEKCGEIFRRGPGFFIFSCAYCSECFDAKEVAFDHIENHFLLEPPICMEPINPETILLDNIQEIQIDENSIQPFDETIYIEPLKIEIQDPFLNNFTGDNNIKYEYELAPEIEEAELSNVKKPKHETANKKIDKDWIVNRKKIIKCHVCGKEMQNASLTPHLKSRHGIFRKSTAQCSSEKEATDDTEQTQLDTNSEYIENIEPTKKSLHMVSDQVVNKQKLIVDCNECGKQMQYKHLSRHLKKSCISSTSQCSGKESKLSLDAKQTQLDTNSENIKDNNDSTLKKSYICNNKRTINCSKCGNQMQYKHLNRHLKNFCDGSKKETTLSFDTKQQQLNANPDDIDSNNVGFLTYKRIVTCTKCGKQMQYKHLNRHLRNFCVSSTAKCNPNKEPTLEANPIQVNTNSVYIDNKQKQIVNCKECGTSMQYKHLSRHLKNSCSPHKYKWGPSTSNILLECDICGDKLRKRNILFHLQSHTNLEGYICSVCQKKFYGLKQLKLHQIIHSEHKKYCCHICGHQFHQNSNLTVHLRTHTGEKLYKCNVCNRQFAQGYTLTLHMRIHTGEKPYSCKICGLKFLSNSLYLSHKKRRHLKYRKSYKCEVCGRSFFVKTALQEHCRIHTGERPFTCKICNLSFSRRFSYVQHQILHTGAKPYKCRFCDKKFAQFAARRFHERSIHKDPIRNNFAYE